LPLIGNKILDEAKSKGNLLKAVKDNKEIFTSFCLAKELVDFAFDLVACPRSEWNPVELNEGNMDKIVGIFSEFIVPFIYSDFKKFKGYKEFVRGLDIENANKLIPVEFDDTIKEIEFKLLDLPSNMLNDFYKNNNIYSGDKSSVHKIASEPRIMGPFSEINEIFIRCNKTLIFLDRKMKILLLAIAENSKSDLYNIDLPGYLACLSEFFFMQNILVLFMNIITLNVVDNDIYEREKNYLLKELCFRFDRYLLSQHNKITSIDRFISLKIKRITQNEVVKLINETNALIKKLEYEINNICRDTSNALEKISLIRN